MTKLLKLTIPVSIILSGCASTGAPMAPGSDQFAASNFESQVVDPTPAIGAPEMDAAMSAEAVERYRTGKTKVAKDESETGISINIAPAE